MNLGGVVFTSFGDLQTYLTFSLTDGHGVNVDFSASKMIFEYGDGCVALYTDPTNFDHTKHHNKLSIRLSPGIYFFSCTI